MVWYRFRQVVDSVPNGHKLYRASAPNYDGRVGDASQRLDQDDVDFLVRQGIDSIISFNGNQYTSVEQQRLAAADPPINYLHLRLGDFMPPTLAQFAQANTFFLSNTSTLVHCGHGHGRTGTGITGVQIYTENGRDGKPSAASWIMPLDSNGNNVEKRAQVSILAEQRNLFLPRVTGIPASDPLRAFAVINFTTGYYLALSTDKIRVVSRSPETVETVSSVHQAYQWVVLTDNQGYYMLTNKAVPNSFVLSSSQGAAINDLVTYGTEMQGSSLFTITEVASGDQGRYVISPKFSPTLSVAMDTPFDENLQYSNKTAEMPTKLASKSDSNKPELWVFLAAI